MANVGAPFISERTPSRPITRAPTWHDLRVVSSTPMRSRKTGSVITRVLSSSVGESTKPCTPPAPAPASVSCVDMEIVPALESGLRVLRMSAFAQPKTAPLESACTVPHGKKPSQSPPTPFCAMISRRMVG